MRVRLGPFQGDGADFGKRRCVIKALQPLQGGFANRTPAFSRRCSGLARRRRLRGGRPFSPRPSPGPRGAVEWEGPARKAPPCSKVPTQARSRLLGMRRRRFSSTARPRRGGAALLAAGPVPARGRWRSGRKGPEAKRTPSPSPSPCPSPCPCPSPSQLPARVVALPLPMFSIVFRLRAARLAATALKPTCSSDHCRAG